MTHGIAKTTKSGLWDHSHDPENDLMKKFICEKYETSGKGTTAFKSFDTLGEAATFVTSKSTSENWRIRNNFEQNPVKEIVYDDKNPNLWLDKK